MDSLKQEKEKAMASFNRFRRIADLWQFFEVLLVLGLISWSSGRVPGVAWAAGGCLADFSNYLHNHHVVFLIGNAIIVLLVALCRHTDASVAASGGGSFYDDYVRYSEAAAAAAQHGQPSPRVVESGGGGDGEKQLAAEILPFDDVAEAIEKAARQIERFQRTQSEKLRRQISARPRREFRRSETESRRKEDLGYRAPEIERLSNEEFQRIVDAFIDKNWGGKKSEHENYAFVKMA
ncbi:anaphase-promoting complex subunit 4 [Striga asiatica]|uniref:Anaphase-promoting complex subunit 4 n=1 Tax=Striga asiatica TaxID=4170 RepID=A0A5A7QDR6_STRAF|nr:anaphase-promoting complex subunit 4 [Striga asiatica]